MKAVDKKEESRVNIRRERLLTVAMGRKVSRKIQTSPERSGREDGERM